MDGLGKITSFNDIENLVRTDPVEVAPPKKVRSKEHNQKISKSLKKFNQTSEGKQLRKKRSKKLSQRYSSSEGERIKQNLSKKCGRPKAKAISKAVRKHIYNRYLGGDKIKDLAKEYRVSRTSISRYINEFSPS